MKQELQKLCEEFIANREEVKKVFKTELDSVYPICANIFLSHAKKADKERISECRQFIKDNTGVLNNFRGSLYAPCACLLACSDDPAGKMAQAADNYKLLKEYFFGSDELVLASMLLTDMATPETARAKAERGRTLYNMMKEKHRFLTGHEDSIFAVMLAFSEKSNEAVIAETERCMEILSGMASKDYLQTAAQVLAMSDKPAEEKCARFMALFEAVRGAGMKYGKDYELSVLASLSVSDIPIPQLVQDISEINDYLGEQKGYGGLFGADKRTRLMHAAMLTATYYTPTAAGDAAALSAMLAAIAIMMMIMMIIVMHSVSIASMSH